MNRRNFLRALVAAPIAAPVVAAEAARGYASGGLVSGSAFKSLELSHPVFNAGSIKVDGVIATNKFEWKPRQLSEIKEMVREANEKAQRHYTRIRQDIMREFSIPTESTVNPLQAISDAPSIVPTAPGCRTIIGFTGLVGSGKSEAARYLIETHGFRRGKFATALKEMMRTLLRYRGVDADTIERMIEGDLKEVPTPALNGRTPRHGMQTLGTEWGRDCIDCDLWVDTEMDAQATTPALVFDDTRFPNEAGAIRAAGGVLVRVERAGAGSAVGAAHSSEGQSLGEAITIQNNGTLAEFHERLDHLLTSQVKAGEFRSAVG